MQRTAKYRAFRKKINTIAYKLSAAETNPLGRLATMGIRRVEREYDSMNDKWRARIDAKVEKSIVAYHTPIVQGRDGEWYSAYDMDMAMLNGN